MLEVSGEFSRSLQQLSVLSWLRSVHSDEWKQRKSVRPHLFFRQALATNRTTWRVGCCTADQISLILVMLQPLSCSGIASRTGWVSAEWLSVWSGMETETVGVMSDGCIWLFSVLPPGKSLPVFTWKEKRYQITLAAWTVLFCPVYYGQMTRLFPKANIITLGKNRASKYRLIFDEQFSRIAFLEVLTKMKAHYRLGIIRPAERDRRAKILTFLLLWFFLII